jgi:choline dehydrogenase-like flavoprotein
LILSSRSFDGESDICSQICIVGAGAAGITLACELDGAGVSVVLLEASGTGISGRVSQDPYAGTATGGHLPPSDFRRRAFGGSTTIWGGRCVPYDPIDFEQREYATNSGWPITYGEVAKYYPKAMEYCDAGDFNFSVTGSLDEQASTMIRMIKDPVGDRIVTIEFATRSGKAARVNSDLFVLALGGIETTRFLLSSDSNGRGFGNLSDCLGRYYTCHLENILGVVRSKQPGIVFEFQKTRDGIYARRKLRIRDSAQRREGILNTTFRLHFPNVADPGHRSSVLSAVYLAKRMVIPEYRRILQHGKSDPASAELLAKHIRNVVTGVPTLLSFTSDWIRRRVMAQRKLPYILVPNANGTFPLEFNSEQTPLPESRMTLIDDKDAFGIPRVNIDFRICDADLESICKAYRMLKRQIDASGQCVLELDDEQLPELVAQSFPVSGHHIGTTRMAGGPSDGVVDADCAVYGLPNLFIAGPSVFPTSSHANPVLTITALSVRLAGHLKTIIRN